MKTSPQDLARRVAIGCGLISLPFVGASFGALRAGALSSAHKLYAVATWGRAALGPSSYVVFSSLCALTAFVALAWAAGAVGRGKRDAALQRPFVVLRALTLLHGAVSPFLALRATQHLSPTGRGRIILAEDLFTILSHQAFITLGAGCVAFAIVLLASPTKVVRDDDGEAKQPQPAPSLAVPLILAGVVARVFAGIFGDGVGGEAIANRAELALVVSVVVVTVAVLALSLIAFRKGVAANPVVSTDKDDAPRFSLGPVVRTTATLLLPLFALTVVAWASSRPCDPSGAELEGVATASLAATRPLPLARTGTENDDSATQEGVWVVAASKHAKDVWPRGIGTREIRLVVKRDVDERGKTGIFARFGDGRFGVLRMTARERDATLPPSCASLPVGGRRCVEATTATMDASLTKVKASGDPPSVTYVAQADATIADVARDVSRLTDAIYETSKSTVFELDVDVLVGLAADAKPAKGHISSPPPRTPPPAKKETDGTHAAPTSERSNGCTAPHATSGVERHDLVVDGQARRLFVSAPVSSPDTRMLIVALHGEGGTPDEMHDALHLEDSLGVRAAVLYPEARAKQWDVETPLAENADVAFIHEAVTWAESAFCIDTHRVFVTGFSSGGTLANVLACAGDFHAVATASSRGPAPSEDEPDAPSGLFRCKPAAALVFNDAADRQRPLDDEKGAAERWRTTNKCAPTFAPDAPGAACESFQGCENRVIRCFAPGMGHVFAPDTATRIAEFFDAIR